MFSESIKGYIQTWWVGIKSLPNTTSIHGFRFIGDSQRHWIERIFWAVFVALSWYASSLLIKAQYDAYQNNPISFVVETTFKDWDTFFPTVAVCEMDNANRIEEVSDRLWGTEHDYALEEILREVTYLSSLSYYIRDYCGLGTHLEECVETHLNDYANMVRSPCEDVISNCTWNGEQFDCCHFFRPIDTELGTCFAINSIQGRETNPSKLNMVSNTKTGPGKIMFDVYIPVKIFILNEEEVPTSTTIGSDVIMIKTETYFRRLITIKNIENDVGARLISPEKRKCRYTDENILQVYRHYSYTACTVQCRKDAQMRLCNCNHHFIPNTPEHEKCNITEITCLSENNHMLSTLKAKWSPRDGLFCDCLPSCTEAEISIVKDFQEMTGSDHSTVEIELSVLPSERYRRNVVRGILDLVVSTGGTGGLFLGASILSFVELFYILLVRPFCDIYSQRYNDRWHKKYGNRRLEDNKFAFNRKF